METSGEQTGYEGCLSLPGKSGIVTRPNYVKAKAFDLDMNEYIIEGEELLARAICHELDHLDGHMYVEKVEGELVNNEEKYYGEKLTDEEYNELYRILDENAAAIQAAAAKEEMKFFIINSLNVFQRYKNVS